MAGVVRVSNDVTQAKPPWLGDTMTLCNLTVAGRSGQSWPERGQREPLLGAQRAEKLRDKLYYPTDIAGVFYFEDCITQFFMDDGVTVVNGIKQFANAGVYICATELCQHDKVLFPRLDAPGMALDDAKAWFKKQRQTLEDTGVNVLSMQRKHRQEWSEQLEREEEERAVAEEAAEAEREREAEEIAELDRVEKELADKKAAQDAARRHAVWRDLCIRQEQDRARVAAERKARDAAADKENLHQQAIASLPLPVPVKRPGMVTNPQAPNFILDSSESESDGGEGVMTKLSQGASKLSLTPVQCGQAVVSQDAPATDTSAGATERGSDACKEGALCEMGNDGSSGAEEGVDDDDPMSQGPSDQGDAEQPSFFTQSCEYDGVKRRSARRKGKVKVGSQEDVTTSQESLVFGNDMQARGAY
eukprot:3937522-Rhodomonas_salina.1